MKKNRLYRIVWLDAYSDDGWQNIKKFEMKPVKVTTIGIIYNKDTDYIYVKNSFCEHIRNQAFQFVAIPIGMLKKCIRINK
jgi:hypothetical protein